MLDFIQCFIITVIMILCMVVGNMLYQQTTRPYEINHQRYLVYHGVTYVECKSVEIEVMPARLKEK